MKMHLVFATQEGPLAVVLFLKVLQFLQPPNFGPKIREIISTENVIFCYAKDRRYCCHLISFCLEFLVLTVGDITTILGI